MTDVVCCCILRAFCVRAHKCSGSLAMNVLFVVVVSLHRSSMCIFQAGRPSPLAWLLLVVALMVCALCCATGVYRSHTGISYDPLCVPLCDLHQYVLFSHRRLRVETTQG